jgi:hypothetical protein
MFSRLQVVTVCGYALSFGAALSSTEESHHLLPLVYCARQYSTTADRSMYPRPGRVILHPLDTAREGGLPCQHLSLIRR